MNRPIRHVLAGLAILAACLPLCFFSTFILVPFWLWLEDRYGIEAVGHSGPAEWCFWATYGLLAAAGLLLYGLASRQGSRRF